MLSCSKNALAIKSCTWARPETVTLPALARKSYKDCMPLLVSAPARPILDLRHGHRVRLRSNLVGLDPGQPGLGPGRNFSLHRLMINLKVAAVQV